jgi:hypothetical protein
LNGTCHCNLHSSNKKQNTPSTHTRPHTHARTHPDTRARTHRKSPCSQFGLSATCMHAYGFLSPSPPSGVDIGTAHYTCVVCPKLPAPDFCLLLPCR